MKGMGWRIHCFRLVWVEKLPEHRLIWGLDLFVIIAVIWLWGAQTGDRLAIFLFLPCLRKKKIKPAKTVISKVDLVLQSTNMTAVYIYVYKDIYIYIYIYHFNYGNVVFSVGWNTVPLLSLGAWVDRSSIWSVLASFHCHHFPNCLVYI